MKLAWTAYAIEGRVAIFEYIEAMIHGRRQRSTSAFAYGYSN